mmetsp:Transcript_20066/g.48231  ORF Transcript_20066/g.48231 Transcript_20066/m.48231 type:complete len:463 (-) Transcript_20066:455-1843(-)
MPPVCRKIQDIARPDHDLPQIRIHEARMSVQVRLRQVHLTRSDQGVSVRVRIERVQLARPSYYRALPSPRHDVQVVCGVVVHRHDYAPLAQPYLGVAVIAEERLLRRQRSEAGGRRGEIVGEPSRRSSAGDRCLALPVHHDLVKIMEKPRPCRVVILLANAISVGLANCPDKSIECVPIQVSGRLEGVRVTPLPSLPLRFEVPTAPRARVGGDVEFGHGRSVAIIDGERGCDAEYLAVQIIQRPLVHDRIIIIIITVLLLIVHVRDDYRHTPQHEIHRLLRRTTRHSSHVRMHLGETRVTARPDQIVVVVVVEYRLELRRELREGGARPPVRAQGRPDERVVVEVVSFASVRQRQGGSFRGLLEVRVRQPHRRRGPSSSPSYRRRRRQPRRPVHPRRRRYVHVAFPDRPNDLALPDAVDRRRRPRREAPFPHEGVAAPYFARAPSTPGRECVDFLSVVVVRL